MAWHHRQTFRCNPMAFSLMKRLWIVQLIFHRSRDAGPLLKILRNGSFSSVKFENNLSCRTNPKLMKAAFCPTRVVLMRQRISPAVVSSVGLSTFMTRESELLDPIVLGPLRESSTKVRAWRSHPERWLSVSTKEQNKYNNLLKSTCLSWIRTRRCLL